MLNFAVGPVMMDQEILEIGAQQVPYFRTAEFSELMLENERLLKKLVHASPESRVIFLTAPGTGGMESTVTNIFNKNDKLLVVNGGGFGARFVEICNIYEIPCDVIKLNYGEALTAEHLLPYNNAGYTGMLVHVHETSTGVLYDMNLIHNFCKQNKILLVADAISSFCADHYDMTEYGVAATIISTQKGLALPPGMSFIILNEEAIKRVESNNLKQLYFNFKSYLRDGLRGQTPYTPAVGILLQLKKRLEMIDAKGIETVVQETKEIADYFREQISSLPFVITSDSFSNAMTPLHPTVEMAADDICLHVKDNYDMFLCPNGGDLAKEVFRVGHIGSISKDDIDKLICLLGDVSMY